MTSWNKASLTVSSITQRDLCSLGLLGRTGGRSYHTENLTGVWHEVFHGTLSTTEALQQRCSLEAKTRSINDSSLPLWALMVGPDWGTICLRPAPTMELFRAVLLSSFKYDCLYKSMLKSPARMMSWELLNWSTNAWSWASVVWNSVFLAAPFPDGK